jgi:hypothetical protein
VNLKLIEPVLPGMEVTQGVIREGKVVLILSFGNLMPKGGDEATGLEVFLWKPGENLLNDLEIF